jgi:hypothetical protein
MRLFLRVREHACARPSLQFCQIASMIQVAVRQQNCFYRCRGQTQFSQEPPDNTHLTKHPRIQQYTVMAFRQQKTTAHKAANGMEIRPNIFHCPSIKSPQPARHIQNFNKPLIKSMLLSKKRMYFLSLLVQNSAANE